MELRFCGIMCMSSIESIHSISILIILTLLPSLSMPFPLLCFLPYLSVPRLPLLPSSPSSSSSQRLLTRALDAESDNRPLACEQLHLERVQLALKSPLLGVEVSPSFKYDGYTR